MKQVAAVRVRLCVIVVFAICLSTIATAQYVPNPRDLGAHRFLLDDGTGNGFFGIIRLNAPLTNHIFYDFPATASGSFIFSNSSGGQSIAGGLTVSGGLNADLLTLGSPLAATSGGTGFGSYAVGDLLYANSITSLSRLPIGSNGQILTISGGSPTWSNTAGGLLLPFNQITNGTNTGQANLEVGNGSAMYPVGTGAITANRFVTSTSLTDNVDLATSEVSGVLPDANVSNTLTITGGSIDGTPIGSTTASSGRFTTITGTSLPGGSVSTTFVMSNSGALETRTAGSLTGIVGVSTNGTLTGDGTSGTPLGINFGSVNTWTGTQTLPTTAAQGNALIASTNAGSNTINAARIGNGLTNTQVNDDLTISGGTVDNTPVGATTRSTGAFTTLNANGVVTLGDGNDNITLNAGSGIISMSGDKLENVADPTAAQDAATKNYVDNLILTGFVQLGPVASQSYSGAQPLIRLNENGASSPNLLDLQVAGVSQILVTNAGALTATSIQSTPIGSTTRSTGSFTALDGNGNVTLGDAAADVITVNGTSTFASPVTANGAATLGNGNDNITLNAGSGIISMSGDKLENVANPTAAQDAATKNYVDNGFIRLGPNPSQAYTGTQPLIRLDETGASAPSLVDLRVGGTAQLVVTNAGALTATSIQNTPIGSTTRSTGSFTVLDANGSVTLGDAAADVITVNGTSTFASPVTANGAVTLGNGNDNITLNAGSGIISMSGDKVENVANPTAAQDAATKTYVDNTALGGVVGPFVQLGPAALQAYTGANPLIRLDETGGGSPNLMDLRVGGTAQLTLTNAGALTATSIQNTPIGSTTRSTGSFTVLDANGNVTLGDAAADVITVNGTSTFASPVTANGAVTLGNGNDNITLNAGSGIISMSGDKLENVADPTAAQDAATKNYVDNGFIRLGPNPSQAYTGTQPLIRLDETGASSPSLVDLRVGGTAQLVVTNAGALTATSIQSTPIGSTTRSTGSFTALDGNGNVTLGDAAADVITVNGTSTFASPVTANGAVTLGNGNDNITLNAGSGIISMSGDKLENVADPTAAQDAATKNYVDNGFIRLGPNPSQAYTGTQPLIRLDETGASSPSLVDLRVGGTAQLVVTNAGALTATSIQSTPIGSTTRSTGSFTALDGNGNVTLGDAAADVITVNGTSTFASPVTANGAVTLGNGNDNITLNAGSGIISMSGDKLENVADPTAAQDAATKNYVDNGFVQIGPAASQSYTGANPVIRLDETGASAPSLIDLRVGGAATFTVTNNGTVRVGTTTSATNSRLTVRDGHVQSQQTTAPTTGTLGAGVTSATLSNATDVAGVINITTNGAPATGAQATVTFNLAYGTAPIIVLSPANNNASGITAHTTRNTAGFTINFNAIPAAATSYQFYYHVIETQ